MNMEISQLKRIIEAVLLAVGQPVDVDKLLHVFTPEELVTKDNIQAALLALAQEQGDNSVYELKEVASGYRLQLREDLAPWIARLWEEKAPRYSRAFLETLVLIAYRQPITRAEIEDIRGVTVSTNIVRTLMEREWVRIVGHRDVPGKPALLATTRKFLDYFNLKSLDELPTLDAVQDLEEASGQLSEQLELLFDEKGLGAHSLSDTMTDTLTPKMTIDIGSEQSAVDDNGVCESAEEQVEYLTIE